MKTRTYLIAAALSIAPNIASAVLVSLGGPSSFHNFFASPPPPSTISFVKENPSSPTVVPLRGMPGVYDITPGHIYTIVQSIDGMDTPVTKFLVNADGSYTYLGL